MFNYRTQKIVYFIAVLLILPLNIIARGGGGGGGASTGSSTGDIKIRILGYILQVLFAITLFFIIRYKIRKSKKIIEIASNNDPAWNFEWMEQYAREVFFGVQKAWMERSTEYIQNNITTQLNEDYTFRFSEMIKNHRLNLMEDIVLYDVKIIGAEDYLDNSKDKFSARITGYMIDYMVDDTKNELISNLMKNYEDFVDIYHFTRIEDGWYLNSIENDPSFIKVAKCKTHFEN